MPQQVATVGRILVVVPQPDCESPVAQMLAQDGHTVFICDSAQTLAMTLEHHPDLIVLDTPLPGAVGLSLLANLHAQTSSCSIPVIFLTAGHDHQRLLNAFEAGAVACLRKPFDGNELLAQVRVHLNLKLTRDRLALVAQQRQELVNLVAHDLKNPLTSVLFACEMLALPDCKPARVPRYLQIIDDSAHEALGYIRSYLESQANTDATKPAQGCAHLDDTLRWLATRYELQLEANGLRLLIRPPVQEACVAISGLVLRQLGENLISNALKYARSGGELELEVRAGNPGYWQLLAQDRGPGVPVHFQSRLFTPFQRLETQDTQARQSSGLGLALARQIVINAGGRLWYEDREGGGARFLLELPEAVCSASCC